jgi:hypothetical protein
MHGCVRVHTHTHTHTLYARHQHTRTQVDDLLQQRCPSAVVMAYGVTNAGKTFTMQV